MFEINGRYANRKGNYTVLAIEGPIMEVRYDDGSLAELNINIQERIWENIVAEREAASASRSRRRATGAGPAPSARHYIKVVSIAPGEELTFPGWEEHVVMIPDAARGHEIQKGDRLIYFAQEAQVFFAVATVTGDSFVANPKKYTYTVDKQEATFFQIDVDADTGSLEKGVSLDTMELESCPDFAAQPVPPESLCPLGEDDFELLAEALTEISEDEEEDFEEDDFDEDEDE